MQLVNSLGEIVEFSTSESKYIGGTSKIYEVDESTLLKVHEFLSGRSLSPLEKDVFDLLKTIKHENFIKLIERYNRIPETRGKVEAYTYEHIKEQECNLLYLRTDFMIEQFNNIQNLFEIFSSLGIVVSDVHSINSIVLNDRIVIIDPDFFTLNDNIKIRKELNKWFLCLLMKSYFALGDYQKREYLFDNMAEEKNPVLTLEMRLKGCKRPIDYFSNK